MPDPQTEGPSVSSVLLFGVALPVSTIVALLAFVENSFGTVVLILLANVILAMLWLVYRRLGRITALLEQTDEVSPTD